MDSTSIFPPVVTMQDLPRLRQEYRRQNKTIVSTNGCFDLLHAAHARMLSQARQLGDVLVVGLNDDDSVRSLKGPTRPLINQADRAAMLAALKPVDHVVIFSGLLPNEMLDLLQPDVHCKSGDYTPESMPEADVVIRHGGRIHILPFQKGYATSEILNHASKAALNPAPAAPDTASGQSSDLLSLVLSALLGTANACRQMSYQLAAPIVQAATDLDHARRKGGKIYVWADGSPDARQIVAQMPQPLAASLAALPPGPEASRVIADSASASDALLIVLNEETQVLAIQSAAKHAGLKTVVITSAGQPADSGTTSLQVSADSPLLAMQLRLAVLQTLVQALERMSRDM